MGDVRTLLLNERANLRIGAAVPGGAEEQRSLAQRWVVGDGGVVAHILHHAMSGAAKQFHLGVDHGIFAAGLLIPVMNYKDAKALHVRQPASLSSQRVSRPSIWRRRNSRTRFPLRVSARAA